MDLMNMGNNLYNMNNNLKNHFINNNIWDMKLSDLFMFNPMSDSNVQFDTMPNPPKFMSYMSETKVQKCDGKYKAKTMKMVNNNGKISKEVIYDDNGNKTIRRDGMPVNEFNKYKLLKR